MPGRIRGNLAARQKPKEAGDGRNSCTIPSTLTSDPSFAIAPPAAPPPPQTRVPQQGRGAVAWLARNVVLPLTPFVIGATIRIIRSGTITISAFDPGELAFSLAMLCVIGVASARRLQDRDDRDVSFSIFVIGVAFFVSMFAFAVIEESRLINVRNEAMTAAITQLKSGTGLSSNQVTELSRDKEQRASERTLHTIFWVLVVVGAIIVPTMLALRDRYGLGDE
jgi:uncharacterized membrane protein YoaK (UPF0700 family)